MKKVILGLALVFAVSFSASVSANEGKAKKKVAKTETCCKKDAKACDKAAKACDKDAKACDKKAKACDKKGAEKKSCCAKDAAGKK